MDPGIMFFFEQIYRTQLQYHAVTVTPHLLVLDFAVCRYFCFVQFVQRVSKTMMIYSEFVLGPKVSIRVTWKLSSSCKWCYPIGPTAHRGFRCVKSQQVTLRESLLGWTKTIRQLGTQHLWSQWNVEIPDKKPWFRWTGVFSYERGMEMVSSNN